MSDDEQNNLEALRQQIQWARQALRVEAELPQLGYSGGEISLNSDALSIPLTAGRSTARLVMDPVTAKQLADNVNAVLSARRQQAARTVLEGHVPEPDRKGSGAYCANDGMFWPCPTAIALGVEGDHILPVEEAP